MRKSKKAVNSISDVAAIMARTIVQLENQELGHIQARAIFMGCRSFTSSLVSIKRHGDLRLK